MKLIRHFLLIYTLFSVSLSFSQSVPGPFDGNSFTTLNEERSKLNVKIPELENKVQSYYYRDESAVNNDISYVNSDINYYKALINKSNDTVKTYYEDKLKYAENRLTFLQDELKRSKDEAKQKASYQGQVDSLKTVRNNIEYKINQLMIPKISQQNFMFWASIAFVVLMFILLYTFFSVVNSDTNVRAMIFGSDSGIQFVTLFSIIIAIILFGLTGILEGKELSALLGSIAGYILGKAKFSNEKAIQQHDRPQGESNDKPQDEPQNKPQDKPKDEPKET